MAVNLDVVDFLAVETLRPFLNDVKARRARPISRNRHFRFARLLGLFNLGSGQFSRTGTGDHYALNEIAQATLRGCE
jgi:hypothetical protein